MRRAVACARPVPRAEHRPLLRVVAGCPTPAARSTFASRRAAQLWC